MSVNLSPVAGAAAQFLDNSGNVLTGGKLYTYLAGTTTPAATYTSSVGVTFHINPIILDAAGRVPNGGEIWLSDNVQYKFVLKDANDVLIGTWDNLVGINSNFVNYSVQEEIQVATAGQTVFTLGTITYTPGTNSLTVYVDGVNQYDGNTYAYVETNANTVTFTQGLHVGALVKFTTAVQTTGNATNAALVVYDPAGTGAVSTTVQAKLRETVSVKDFGAVGDGVTDDTVAVQAALSSASLRIYFPAGTYKITSVLNTITDTKILYGDGCDLVAANSASILKFSASIQGLVFSGAAASFSQVYSLGIVGSDSGAGLAIGLTVSTPRFSAENVSISAFGSHGVLVESAGSLNANLSRFKNVVCRGNFGNGFSIGNGAGADENALTFDGCEGGVNAGYGFWNDGNHNLFLNCVTVSNTTGAFFDSGNSNQYILPYIESGTGANVDIDATSTFGLWLSGLYADALPTFNSASSRNSWVVIQQGGFGGRLMINDIAGYTTGNQYRFENGIFAAGELSLRNVTLNNTLQSIASDSSVFRQHIPFAPYTDSNLDCGKTDKRWANVWAVDFRPGTGSVRPIWTAGSGTPEGVVTGSVGSIYTRTNGGAGTTLYIKESGSGNTGWVAK